MDAFLVVVAVCMAASFAVCGIPFGLLIAKWKGDVDVREVGSGNIGMTNVARTVGGGAAALTFACDVGKGTLSMVLSRAAINAFLVEGVTLEHTEPGFAALTLVYLCCVLGHVYSPYLGFHGGKGISVGLGAALGMYWPLGLSALFVFFLLVIPTGFISLGSIGAALSIPPEALFLWHFTPWATVPLCFVSIIVVFAHRQNILKLMHGEESRFSIKDRADKARRRRRGSVPPTERKEGER